MNQVWATDAQKKAYKEINLWDSSLNARDKEIEFKPKTDIYPAELCVPAPFPPCPTNREV